MQRPEKIRQAVRNLLTSKSLSYRRSVCAPAPSMCWLGLDPRRSPNWAQTRHFPTHFSPRPFVIPSSCPPSHTCAPPRARRRSTPMVIHGRPSGLDNIYLRSNIYLPMGQELQEEEEAPKGGSASATPPQP